MNQMNASLRYFYSGKDDPRFLKHLIRGHLTGTRQTKSFVKSPPVFSDCAASLHRQESAELETGRCSWSIPSFLLPNHASWILHEPTFSIGAASCKTVRNGYLQSLL